MHRSTLQPCVFALALTACVGDIGTGDEPGGPGDETEQKLVPSSPTIHRLTAPQLQNTYRALFGEPLQVPTDLPKDDVLYGFSSIAAAATTISSLDAEKYESATYEVLDQVWLDPQRRDELVGCQPQAVSEACVRIFLEDFAKKAWRRPVDPQEIDGVLAVGEGVAADLGGDVQQGVKFAVATILQSPGFLFRVEVGEPAPDREGMLRFTSWEMASRLSYLILDAPPDDELLAAAEADTLTDPEVVRAEAQRLVDDPRARQALGRFFGDFMTIHKLDALDKSPDKFPAFSAALGPAMRIEIERMFENIVFEEVVALVGAPLARRLRALTLEIYDAAATFARERGVILADTKFEFGFALDASGRPGDELLLIDEVLTPDSSRFWPAEAWRPGAEQPSFDKQFLREWLLEQVRAGAWAKRPPGPELPPDIVARTLERYEEAFRRLWGSPAQGAPA